MEICRVISFFQALMTFGVAPAVILDSNMENSLSCAPCLVNVNKMQINYLCIPKQKSRFVTRFSIFFELNSFFPKVDDGWEDNTDQNQAF